MFVSEWREFPSAPCLAGKKKNFMTASVSMLKLCASLTGFEACFLPGWAKDLPAPQYMDMLTTGFGTTSKGWWNFVTVVFQQDRATLQFSNILHEYLI
jgi:hypothetical protein